MTVYTTLAEGQDLDTNSSSLLFEDLSTSLNIGGDGATANVHAAALLFNVGGNTSTGTLFSSATLALTVTGGGTAFGKTFRVSGFKDPNQVIAVGDPVPADSGDTERVVLGTHTLSASAIPSGTALSITLSAPLLNSLYRNTRFTGTGIWLLVESVDYGATELTNFVSEEVGVAMPTLTTSEHSQYLGWRGMPMSAHGRGITDDRFGMPTFSTARVTDKYNRGISVLPEHADPEEEIPSYRPSPTEGARIDEPVE